MRGETLRLLGESPGFARLWLAEVVSLGGDWFTIIALAVVVSRWTSGSGLAVSGLLITQFLPMATLGPLSGVLVDRFDRRRLLILSDLARVVIVLLFIPAAASGRLGLLYGLSFLHFTVQTVFEPGRSALVPSLVKDADLVRASTLASVTWSAMAAIGGMAGGAILSAVGTTAAFAIDALTFLASALLIAGIPPVPGTAQAHSVRSAVRLRDALGYMARFPVIAATALVKAINGVAVVDTFIVLYATRLFVIGDSGAGSVGLFYACFGLGAVIGPLLLNRLNDGTGPRMRLFIGFGSGLLSSALLLLSAAPSVAVAGLALVLRGVGGSANWTFSTILLQKGVPDGLRGRVFAVELAAAHLAFVLSALAWGHFADVLGLREAVLAAGVVTLIPLALWTSSLGWMRRREAACG